MKNVFNLKPMLNQDIQNVILQQFNIKNVFEYVLLFTVAIQQKLLSVCAERSEDTMEHCRLVLLLLNRFPQSSTELAVRISKTLQ